MSTSKPNEQNLNRDPKRKRDSSPELIEIIQVPKIPRVRNTKPYEMSQQEFTELKKLISESKNIIEMKISDSQNSIESKLNDFTTTFKEEVQSIKISVDEFKSTIAKDIDTIKSHMHEHSKRLDNTEDDINRIKLATDLRLIGFPHNQNENLFELFAKIAAIIGYDTTLHISVPIIERVPIRNRANGTLMPSSTILFHFTSVQIKQHFYTLYLNKMPLKPEAFGLPQENRIVIGENLTQKNAFLFKKAQMMRNEKKIAQVFTADGLVKIKFSKGINQNTYTIRNTLELERLVAQQQQCEQQVAHQHAMELDEPNNSPLPNADNTQTEAQQQLQTSFQLLPNEIDTQSTQASITTALGANGTNPTPT